MPGFWHFCITPCLGGQKGTNKVKQQQVDSAKIVKEKEVKEIQHEKQQESVDNDSSKEREVPENLTQMQNQLNKYGEVMKLIQNKNGCYKIQPIRKSIRFTVENCAKLFKRKELITRSFSIDVLEVSWFLQIQEKQEGFFGLFLHLKMPDDFKGKYRFEVEYHLSILHAFHDQDLVHKATRAVYQENKEGYDGWGKRKMAKFEDLLDPAKGFLRADGSIEVEADFTIKSATLDHLI